ncbi:RsmD family RNA methyltransferase [Sphingobacterium hungaricum]|uniref:16S rRNA (Guanine(966)-N(2))-methyltransferase RsmD n=1 Tax=Sphingobacterium hungaricum TaxID=2082723 RepID=A0A928V0X6_9SPHI|nr:RsmD family RNA methyltransferase [Sphingobacterium hungaricum]MBE8714951.1 16S rRNA (guanine(966)-N(2))-methyltransferase RsmD [Sphingobacterium hungaricum]
MRIIGGRLGGLRLNPPSNLPVRPTTDLAKEALFNILQNRLDFDELICMDLFAGTGNISFELASRGVESVLAIDIHFKCLAYIQETAKKMAIDSIRTQKADVLKFVSSCKDKFNFIFADPPYDLPRLPQLANMIFENELLLENGWLVIEHPSNRIIESSSYFVETRKYGISSFSFYQFTSN